MISPVPLFIHEINTNITLIRIFMDFVMSSILYTHMHAMNDMFSLNPLIYLPILSICLSCSCDLTDLSRLSSNKTFFSMRLTYHYHHYHVIDFPWLLSMNIIRSSLLHNTHSTQQLNPFFSFCFGLLLSFLFILD